MRKLIILTPWGSPSGWYEIEYQISCDVNSDEVLSLRSKTTTLIYQKLAERKLESRQLDSYRTYLITADTLWNARDIEKGELFNYNYSRIVKAVENMVNEFIDSFNLVRRELRVYICPGIGTFKSDKLNAWISFSRAEDSVGSAADYRIMSFLYLIDDLMGYLQEGDEVDLWLDITHGVNYMPVLSYSNAFRLANWIGLWTGREVNLRVYQASPVFPMREASTLKRSMIAVLKVATVKPHLPEESDIIDILKAYSDRSISRLFRYLRIFLPELKTRISKEWDEKFKSYRELLMESVRAYLFFKNWLLLPAIFSLNWELLQPKNIEHFLREWLTELKNIYYMDEMFSFVLRRDEIVLSRYHALSELAIELILLLAGVRRLSIVYRSLARDRVSELELDRIVSLYSGEEFNFVKPQVALREMAKEEPGKIYIELSDFEKLDGQGKPDLSLWVSLADIKQFNRRAKGQSPLTITYELRERNFLAHGGLDYTRTFVKRGDNRYLISFRFRSDDEKDRIAKYIVRKLT